MINILLCCSAGMSTSLFVQKTNDYASKNNIDIETQAIPFSNINDHLESADVIALAPQIRFQKEKAQELTSKPVYVVDMRDYGTMNVEKVLSEIMKLAEN